MFRLFAPLVLLLIGAPVFPADEPTYSRDIAPIFQRACQQCHHDGEATPMSLMSYAETRPWVKAVAEVTRKRTMPPWHADLAFGEFSNNPRLSETEIELIQRWVVAGAPEGDPKDLPAPREFTEGWTIGKPDLIVELPNSYNVPAEGDDQWIDTEIALNLESDKWIQAVEVRPSSRRVVHHAMVYVIQDTAIDKFWTEYLGRNSYLLCEHAVGNKGDVYPPGTGRLLRKDARLMVQVHYHPNGTAETDRTSIGLKFYQDAGSVNREVSTIALADFNLRIPANTPAFEHTAGRRFERPVRVISFQPHMHFRGKAMKLQTVDQTGKVLETLCSVPRYDPNWQITYTFKEPVLVPPGVALVVTGIFDNSKDNPLNPDPNRTVPWGPLATDEMMIGWVDMYYADPEG